MVSRKFIFWVKKVLLSLKLPSLFLIALYYIIILSRASVTNNWDSSRKNGLSQSNICISSGTYYNVELFDVSPSSNNGYQPLAFSYSLNSAYKDFCFSKNFPLSSLSNLNTFGSVESFTSHFKSSTRNYFQFSIYIVVLAFLGLLVTFIYEDTETDSLDGGQFSSGVDRLTMIRLNLVVSIVMIILMIISGLSFRTIYGEDCQGLFLPKNEKNQNFCSDLSSDNAIVSSTISPNEFLIDEYLIITMFLASLHVVGLLSKLLISPPSEHYEPDYFSQGRVLPEIDDEERNNFSQINQSLTNVEMPMTNINEIPESEENENLYIPHQENLKPELIYRLIDKKKLKSLSDDCTICLCPLNYKKHQKGENKKDRLKSNRGFDLSDTNDSREFNEQTSIRDQEEFSNFFNDINYVVELNCGHFFHKKCIIEWSESHSTCPICRSELEKS